MLKEVLPNKYVYHTSNPIFRDKISKEGLITKGKSETWLSDTKIDGKVIFAVNSDNPKKWWDSTYDDDIYRIDTTELINKWYNDPNFDLEDKRIITFENIPLNSIKLIYKGTGKDIMNLAPNGKPSNLTPEQYKLVRTPEFKAWFGDWEKAYETGNYHNVSKVIDEQTKEPLVVWHGTKEKWWENTYFVFNPQLEGKSTNVVRRKFGASYFTSKKEVAESFGNILIEVFLNFKKPIQIDANYSDIIDVDDKIENIEYDDDIIVRNTNDIRNNNVSKIFSDIYITTKIFGAIKLADGTNTTFDSNNPDIRFDGGGGVGEIIVKVIDEISTDEIDSKILKQFLDRKSIIKWLGYTYKYKKEKEFEIPDMHFDKKGNVRMFRYENFYDIYEKSTKDSSGEIVNRGDIYFYKKTEDEIKEILLSFIKENYKRTALALASSEFNITQIGEPRILLIEDNKIIGIIFRSINQASSYKFDIFIKENKRRMGYSKILLDAMLNDFVSNFPNDKQIRAEVHNKELLKFIKDKYGFTCKNKKDYYGEDVVLYDLINESYYNVKDCVLTRQKVEKYLGSNPDIRYEDGGDIPEGTKLLPLTMGKFAIVDAEDFDYLNQWKWRTGVDRSRDGKIVNYYGQRTIYIGGKTPNTKATTKQGSRYQQIITLGKQIMGIPEDRKLRVDYIEPLVLKCLL